MKLSSSYCLLGATIGVAFLPSVAHSKAILGIDLGSLYMKVALVQRNAPLEIVTNLHSKRKTENMILFDSGTRFYGSDASSLLARKPLKTPSGCSVMLGRGEDHPNIQILTERHYPLTPSYNATRSGVTVQVDGNSFTPEELTSMVLAHAKDITTESYGHANVKDCVLTVPCFATQHERRALLDAALLADLNVLSLVDENTAAALNFGMDKVTETPEIVIFYNMGGSSLQVSVVKYLSYPHKDTKFGKERVVGGFEVLSKAWDATLGGQSFDQKLVDFMADEFNKSNPSGNDVRTSVRAMMKLKLQANKVKHVLSANTDFPIYIDGLFEDKPLSLSLSRAKLEELCHDLYDRATAPIQQALTIANLTLSDVSAIELIGGGMRVPKVQEELKSYLDGKLELGLHINSDESMALGAAFHGANISTAFKVRHVGMADINPFPVSIDLISLESSSSSSSSTDGDGDDDPWSKHATMFKSFGKVGVKKTIAFTHDEDVHCAIDYEDSDLLPIGTETSLERYNITGVSKFAKEMEKQGLGKPKVSLQFELSSSGITELVKAEAAVEEMYTVEEEVEVDDDEEVEVDDDEEATADAADAEDASDETKDDANATVGDGYPMGDIENPKNDTDTAAAATEGDETKTEDETKKDDATDDEKNKTATKTAPKKKKKKTKMVEKEKKKVHKRTLDVVTYHVGTIQPYNDAIREESMQKLVKLDKMDEERIALEEARNKVESYIYFIKNKISDNEEDAAKVSTEEQRDALVQSANDAEEWMYEDGYTADLATFVAKYEELSTPCEKVWFRMAELTARPEAIKALETKLSKVEDLMKAWETTMTQVTEEERADVLVEVETVKTWIAEQTEAQSKADPTAEDPVFVSADVPLQTKGIESTVQKLRKKPKPKPIVKEKDNETKAEETDGETTEDLDDKNETVTEAEVDAEDVIDDLKEATEEL